MDLICWIDLSIQSLQDCNGKEKNGYLVRYFIKFDEGQYIVWGRFECVVSNGTLKNANVNEAAKFCNNDGRGGRWETFNKTK